MPNKKDICPECGVNEKGVRAKTCRPCSVKALAAINKKAEETNNLLTKAAKAAKSAAIDTLDKIERMHEEAGNSDTVFGPGAQVERMGVDPAVPGEDKSVVATIKEGDIQKCKVVGTQTISKRPPRVGETTDDGKFYK